MLCVAGLFLPSSFQSHRTSHRTSELVLLVVQCASALPHLIRRSMYYTLPASKRVPCNWGSHENSLFFSLVFTSSYVVVVVARLLLPFLLVNLN